MRRVHLGVGERYPCESVRHARNVTSILAVSVCLFLHKICCRCNVCVCTAVVRCHLQEVDAPNRCILRRCHIYADKLYLKVRQAQSPPCAIGARGLLVNREPRVPRRQKGTNTTSGVGVPKIRAIVVRYYPCASRNRCRRTVPKRLCMMNAQRKVEIDG